MAGESISMSLSPCIGVPAKVSAAVAGSSEDGFGRVSGSASSAALGTHDESNSARSASALGVSWGTEESRSGTRHCAKQGAVDHEIRLLAGWTHVIGLVDHKRVMRHAVAAKHGFHWSCKLGPFTQTVSSRMRRDLSIRVQTSSDLPRSSSGWIPSRSIHPTRGTNGGGSSPSSAS